MKQKIISQVKIHYYSPKKVSIQHSADRKESKDIQLLLISILNFVNVVYTLKNEAVGIVEEIKSINVTLLDSSLDGHFIPKKEIVKAENKNFIEYFTIGLIQKDNSILLEVNSRDIVNPFYRYSSVRSLFQAVLNTKNRQLIQILHESLNYIFDQYSISNYGELKLLLELSNYFTDLFAESLVK